MGNNSPSDDKLIGEQRVVVILKDSRVGIHKLCLVLKRTKNKSYLNFSQYPDKAEIDLFLGTKWGIGKEVTILMSWLSS